MKRYIFLATIAGIILSSFALGRGYDLHINAKAATPPSAPEPYLLRIPTTIGPFWLNYSNGRARLIGAPLPLSCGKWESDDRGGLGFVEFSVKFRADPEALCVKKLSTDEEPIILETRAKKDALYLILINNETVFSGRLDTAPELPLL